MWNYVGSRYKNMILALSFFFLIVFVNIYGLKLKKFRIENQLMLVIEYADGDSLRTYLKKNFNNFTWNDKCNLAYQMACAVSSLHDKGIVHCDLVNLFLI